MFMHSMASYVSGNDKPIQIFAACQLATANRTSALMGFTSGGGNGTWRFRVSTATTLVLSSQKTQDAGGGVQVATTQQADGNPHIISFESTGTAMTIRIDGVATSVNNTSQDLSACTLTECTLGASNTGFADGPYLTIGDLIVCTGSLGTSDRNRLLTYLHGKYPSIAVTLS
jgi:hypothetical protein